MVISMAIRIPSKNIYSIQNNKIVNNIINAVSINENDLQKNDGNILSQEYSFTFCELYTFEDGTVTPNNKYNDFQIGLQARKLPEKWTSGVSVWLEKKPNINSPDWDINSNIYWRAISYPAMQIDKICNVKTSNNEITSHYWYSKQDVVWLTYSGVTTSTGIPKYNLETQFVRENLVAPKITSYNKENNIINVRYENAVVKYIDPIYEVTLSETFYIKGTYFNEKESDVNYGTGSKAFSISSNELIQPNTKIENTLVSNVIVEQILTSHKNGKETAVILCSISDYKDTDGNKVIDITTSNRMMFDIGDEVIPYVYTANGIDVPMSIDKAGNAKVFRVVGTKLYDEGIARQELTLQEK